MPDRTNRKIKILIPGNFEEEHFSKEQEQFVSVLVKAINASIILLHLPNTGRLPETHNPLSILRLQDELSFNVNYHLRTLFNRLSKEGLEVTSVLCGHGNPKNELIEQVGHLCPDLIILRSPGQIAHKHLAHKTPVLFIPKKPKPHLPRQVALNALQKSTPNPDQWSFLLQLIRKISGQLYLFNTGMNGHAANNENILKEWNHINLSYGINIKFIDSVTKASPDSVHELAKKHGIELLFILQEKQKSMTRFQLPVNSLKRLLKTADFPIVISTQKRETSVQQRTGGYPLGM